MKCTA